MAAISSNQCGSFEFGAFQLIPSERQLLRDGATVPLPPKAFETLVLLVTRRGHLVEKGELMRMLWPDSFVEEANLTHHVWTLRKALGEGENGRHYIETVPRLGYRFIAEVKEFALHTSADRAGFSAARETDVVLEKHTVTQILSETLEDEEEIAAPSKAVEAQIVSTEQLGLAKGRVRLVLVALVVLVMAVAIGFWFTTRPLTGTTQIESIAVLPFINDSGNAELEYLSDGMTETLINSLAKLPHLSVKSRGSVFRFKGKQVEAKEIGSQLSVQTILNGRFVQHADKVTLYLSLVETSTNNQIWGEKYERKVADLAALQRDIARDVSDKLRSRLTTSEQQALTKGSTENTEAYRAYLKGLYYWSKPGPQSFEKSREYFQQAIDLDPTYALGWAGLAHYYAFAAATGTLPPTEYWPKAEWAMNKALELDSTRAETFNVLAGVQLYYHRDWTAAERSFRHGLELNPRSAELRHHYSKCLLLFGRNDEATAEMRRTVELEPLSLRYNLSLAVHFFFLRQYDSAIDQLHETLELDPKFGPAHQWLGYAYEKKGMTREAVSEWVQALKLRGREQQASSLERTFAASGFEGVVRALAQHELRQLNESLKRGEYVSPSEFATAYMRLGDKLQTLVWLEKAVQERNRFSLEFSVNPLFDNLRNHPGFAELEQSPVAGSQGS